VSVVAGEMRQGFSNIIVNAADALALTGDRLVVHVRNSTNWNSGQKGVRVVMCDNGPGIASKVRTHLFELFQTTKGEKGTGIGLWVSQGIINGRGGTIRCRSSVRSGASGTVFNIFVPFEQTASTDRPLQSAAS